jgi:ATP phosphoribosyltransferase regulatory subunit
MNRIPKGCRNVGGSLAEAMTQSREAVLGTLTQYGYRPLWPSGLQLSEVVWDRLAPHFRNRLLGLNSPFGEPCVLRGDLTLAAVAHLATHYAPHERPLRLCYADRVYRIPGPSDTELEQFQVGAELLGWEGTGADIEVLSLLLRALGRAGITAPTLVLGDVTIFSIVFDGVDPHLARALTAALQEDSYAAYYDMLGHHPLTPGKKLLLEEFPRLKGKPDQVFPKAAELLGSDRPTEALRSIVRSLGRLGFGDLLQVDLALFRELGYYSGPVFEVYLSNRGRALGGGGRYDGLLSRYGLVGQALGFALDLEALAKASGIRRSTPVPIMLWGRECEPEEALRLGEELLSRGARVEMSWHDVQASSRELARLRGYTWWIDASRRTVSQVGAVGDLPLDLWMEETFPC